MSTVQVVGYGSLLSRESALCTAPSVSGFRLVRVPGYVRLFNKVSTRWIAAPETSSEPRIASCAARESPGIEIVGSAFEISASDFPALFEREHQYRWVEVEFREADGSKASGRMCLEWTDEEYRRSRCVTDAEYRRRLGAYWPGRIWRTDILPYPPYLELCLRAARAHGDAVYENFRRTTLLADGVTTLEQYLTRSSK